MEKCEYLFTYFLFISNLPSALYCSDLTDAILKIGLECIEELFDCADVLILLHLAELG
jgi:hypothetical protein